MILAIDTATRWLGLALHNGTAVVAEYGWQSLNTQTIELTPAVGDIFAHGDIDASDLKAIAVAIGPGSYTGLRVGLAVAKGLALPYQVPLIGVPTLDIVAAGLGPLDGQLVVLAEAGRTRVCAGRYTWQARKGWQADGRPVITTWEKLIDRLEKKTFFAGEISAAAAKQLRTSGKPFHALPAAASVRRAGYLAEIGWQRLRRNQIDDATALAPDYLRDPAGS